MSSSLGAPGFVKISTGQQTAIARKAVSSVLSLLRCSLENLSPLFQIIPFEPSRSDFVSLSEFVPVLYAHDIRQVLLLLPPLTDGVSVFIYPDNLTAPFSVVM